MRNLKYEIDGANESDAAKALRAAANGLDPWSRVRVAAFWFFCGALTVASMNYGDVWFCMGDCRGAIEIAPK